MLGILGPAPLSAGVGKGATHSMDSAENPQLIKRKQLKTPLKRIHWLKENQT